MRATLISFLAVSTIISVAAVSEAYALELGPLEATPYLEFTSVYDDNIFVQNGAEVDDYYFLITPGIKLALGQSDNLLELEYNADIFRYVDTGPENDTEDHYIRGAAEINFAGGLSIRLDDLYAMKHEKRSESNLAVSGVTPLSEYNFNDLDFNVRYDISERFSAEAGYKFYITDYDLATTDFRDRTDHGASAAVYYRFMPKTALLMQGIYTNVYHTSDNSLSAARLNSNEYWALTGVTWDITEKTTGTVKGGYEWKDFAHPESNDFDSGVYIVEIDHSFTPKTSVRVSGLREAVETDDPEVSYYTTTGGSARLRFNPVTKLEIMPYGSYAYNRYSGEITASGDTARRKDKVWYAGLDVDYNMNKWLGLSVGYRHQKRSSNLPFYDFTGNMVSISIKGSI